MDTEETQNILEIIRQIDLNPEVRAIVRTPQELQSAVQSQPTEKRN